MDFIKLMTDSGKYVALAHVRRILDESGIEDKLRTMEKSQ